MSAFPDSEIKVQGVRRRGLSPAQFAALATTVSVLGLLAIWPTVNSLWTLWTTDALKSIGMAIPLVSLVLILRVWRTLGWEAEGTWWGMVLLLITLTLAVVQQHAVLIMVISPHWSTILPPPSLMLLAYGSSVVLIVGGTRLYRAALFPIILLLFANPIPHAFSLLVDLPLQQASAHIARAFAIGLGHSLTPDHLRLMFTPDFGMFIAPGCNGIRGSVTMGFIALIAGYVYRFRWYTNAMVVAGAILLGYVFNLVRLCLLVVYYAIALHFTSLQDKAENADYLIGAALFLIATLLLFGVIHRLRDARNRSVLQSVVSEGGVFQRVSLRARYTRLAAMGAILVVGCGGLARANRAINPSAMKIEDAAGARFPTRLGSYTLVRTWNDSVLAGSVVYIWAQYAPAGGGTPIAIGLSPVLGWHDPLICHTVRGEHPLWQGQLTIANGEGAPVNFSSGFYNDGVRQYIEASTICSAGACGEFATERVNFGFVYTRPDPRLLLTADPRRPIPVVVRAETIDMAIPADAARRQLTEDLRVFLGSVRLDQLARQFGS